MTVPLVLLPGMNCSAALWAGVVPALDADGPVVHAQVTEPSLDSAVAALLAELPEVFDLAGLSLGGIVAMALVRRAPQRVRRLALLSTNARPPTDAQRAGWAATLDRLAAGASARDVQEGLLPLLLADPTPAQAADALDQADTVGADLLAAQWRCQGTRVDERPALGRVRVPTLVVAAERDALCPVERHEEIAGLIPGARLVVLPDAGHLSPTQAPAAVAGLLARWRRPESETKA